MGPSSFNKIDLTGFDVHKNTVGVNVLNVNPNDHVIDMKKSKIRGFYIYLRSILIAISQTLVIYKSRQGEFEA